MAASASCVITVDVTSNTVGGPYNNTSANISGLARVTNSVTSTSLTTTALPTLTKAFSAAAIGVGQTATLTFTVTNPAGAPARTGGITFTDAFPANLVIAATPNVLTPAAALRPLQRWRVAGLLQSAGPGLTRRQALLPVPSQ
jgi:uncharacterized repeat protein (TIGR01451 family)